MKSIKLFLLTILILFGAKSVKAQEAYAHLSMDSSTLTFYYDSNRSSRHGSTYDLNTESNEPRWVHYTEDTEQVVFDPSFADARPTSCYSWFYQMSVIEEITGIEYLNTSNVTNMRAMFYGCKHLTSIDLSHFNTSNVTDMSFMFRFCEELTSLDLSHFNTSNVTNMSYMFDGCNKLESLNLNNFNTSKVTNMSAMFSGTNLANLDLRFFKTGNVTDMSSMFRNSNKLTYLNLNYFSTAKVEKMNDMFNGCTQLISVNMSSFITSNVKDMSYMFNECESMTRAHMEGFNTSNVENFSYMFYGCISLTKVDLSNFTFIEKVKSQRILGYCPKLKNLTIPASASNWASDACLGMNSFSSPCKLSYPEDMTLDKIDNEGYYEWKSGYFKDALEAYISIEGDNDQYTFYYDENREERDFTVNLLTTGGNLNLTFNGLSDVTVYIDESFANYKPTKTSRWFSGLNGKIVGLDNLNTSKVTDMSYMFANSTGMTKLDLVFFDTYNATNMNSMFAGCTNLEELNLGNFDFHEGQNTGAFLYGCTNLRRLVIPKTAYYLHYQSCAGVGTATAPCELFYPENFNLQNPTQGDGYFRWKGGYFKESPKPYAVLLNGTLTFYYGYDESNRNGTVFHLNSGDGNEVPEWYTSRTLVNKVVFDPTFSLAWPENCYAWFSGMVNLTEIEGMENLNTNDVVMMGNMFYGCKNLDRIDLSHFNTQHVTWMNSMFQGCSGLVVLDLSTFDTSQALKMHSMFEGCTGLQSLDLDHFNTSKVSTMYNMFKGCTNLKTLKISNFKTEKVTDFTSMFEGCSSLATLDLRSFTIKASNYYTRNMFKGCSVLESLDVPASASTIDGWACTGVGSAESPCQLYYPDGFLPEISDAGNGYFVWKNGYFTDDREAYAILSSDEKTLTFYYDNKKSTHPEYWYSAYKDDGAGSPQWYLTDFTTVIFDPSFADARPTTCRAWFYFKDKLSNIIGIEYLNTSKVTNMERMFSGCKNLTEIDLSHFNTDNVTSQYGFYNMFYCCESLTSLDLSNFWFSSDVSTTDILSSCSSLQTLTVNESVNNWNGENTCHFVGTVENPCTLVRSYDFTLEDAEDHGAYFIWRSGYFKNPPTAYAVISTDQKTLTFYCDNDMDNREGEIYTHLDYEMPEWMGYPVEEVVFDPSFANAKPTSCSSWFNSMSDVTTITGLEYLNTENVENYVMMFYNCGSLTSLDLSNFNFSGHETYGFMNYCSSLRTLTVPASANDLSDDACDGIGTPDNPCTLVYPEGMTLDRTDYGDYFVWKNGYFKEAILMGDANGDGIVSVADVMMVVNYVLGFNPEGFHFNNANVVSDNNISVSDVMAIVEIVLGKTKK